MFVFSYHSLAKRNISGMHVSCRGIILIRQLCSILNMAYHCGHSVSLCQFILMRGGISYINLPINFIHPSSSMAWTLPIPSLEIVYLHGLPVLFCVLYMCIYSCMHLYYGCMLTVGRQLLCINVANCNGALSRGSGRAE